MMGETARTALSLMNDLSVGLFGIVLSASFGVPLRRRRERVVLYCGALIIFFIQIPISMLCGSELHVKLFPLLVHVPTIVMMYVLTRKPLWSVVSVMTAYLFCEIRRWLALLAAAVFRGSDENVRNAAAVIITLPLLLFLLRFASEPIRRISGYPIKTQIQFGLVPAVYYVFDYVSRIYTDLLYQNSPIVLEFMPFICCVAYLLFLLYDFSEEHKREQLRQIQNALDNRLSQAVTEISRLRESQEQTARYRHDLRHHLQYLSSCLEDGQTERARGYISKISGELEALKVSRCCENEAANLILSAFAARAEKMGVRLDVKGAVPADIPVSDNDLCVVLSNSLENALNACEKLPRPSEDAPKRVISVTFRFSEETGKLFLQITNPCSGKTRFEKGVPVSERAGHGIGTRSICAITERRGGCCTFLREDDMFILRLSL